MPNEPSFQGADQLVAGQKVGNGRYALGRFLGRGGMGIVWLARDERLDEAVALKFLPPDIRFDPVALDDLRRETVRSHKLTHPNIIRIHDFHEVAGREAFISMEYVDGPTLGALRLEQPGRVFQWSYLRSLVEQLCAALEYAHEEKVIHRDLKPANMMLDARGRLKLADFGIAAVVSDSMSRISAQRSASGTLTYMSPQQLDGRPPRVSDDIYAFGATLYELLTSKPPFFTGDIPHQVRHVAPDPLAQRLADLDLANEVPPDVAALVMACLAKDSEQRPASARAVAEWIGVTHRPRAGLPVPAPVPAHRQLPKANREEIAAELAAFDARDQAYRAKGEHRVLQLAGSVAALAAVGVAVWFYWPRTVPQPGVAGSPTPGTNLVWVAAGSFTLGSPTEESGHEIDESPQVDVTLSRGFYIGRCEVTQGDFLQLMATNPSRFAGDLSRPVEQVTWAEATNYCARLNAVERTAKRLPEGYEYRLPTEAEWEYAARSGTRARYAHGDDLDQTELARYAWYAANGGNTTHPVGSLRPNAWGLHDLAGNVREWCLNYDADYPGQPMTDPAGPAFGKRRVARGGSWSQDPDGCRSAQRGPLDAQERFDDVGFRVVLAALDSVPPAPANDAPLFALGQRFGGGGEDVVNDVATDAVGNLYVTGSFERSVSLGVDTLASAGGKDVFVGQYNRAGELLWMHQAGGPGEDVGRRLVVDDMGNCYVTGWFSGKVAFEGTTLVAEGKEGIFVAKYDRGGTLQWVQKAGGPASDWNRGLGLALDRTDGFYLCGTFCGTGTFDYRKVASSGRQTMFVARYDRAGLLKWVQKAIVNTKGSPFESVAVDAAGNAYAAGWFGGTANFGKSALTSLGSTDAALAKFDLDGNLQWVQRMGGSGSDLVAAVAVDSQGDVLVGGAFQGVVRFGVTSLTATGEMDLFVAKYSPAGAVRWARTIKSGGATAWTGLRALVPTSDGGAYVAGCFSGMTLFGAFPLGSEGGLDVFLLRLSPAGEPVWARRGGGRGDDHAFALALGPDGGLCLAGDFQGTASLDGELSSAGGADGFVARLKPEPSPRKSAPAQLPE